MNILTTCIGAFPKPSYVPVIDWFTADIGANTSRATELYDELLEATRESAEDLFAMATREVMKDQVTAGIDIPTDGEIRRENYIHYHCRNLEGIDFANLTGKRLRQGAYQTNLPTITGPIEPKPDHFLPQDYRIAQSYTDRPVKMTLPGPLTIADTTADSYYGNEKSLGSALAQAINVEITALVEAGCRHIQIDEPLFARKPEQALDFGIEHLVECFNGVSAHVNRMVHICCGYPRFLDEKDYHKADPQIYFELADGLDDAPIDQVSIEDAHRPNDLSLLERFSRTTVVLGLVDVARSRIETVEAIRNRLRAALNHIDKDRLMAAPDCGLGLLGRDLAVQKLTNLSTAAHSL